MGRVFGEMSQIDLQASMWLVLHSLEYRSLYAGFQISHKANLFCVLLNYCVVVRREDPGLLILPLC